MVWGVLSVVSLEIVWAGPADSQDDALEHARVACERTRASAAWTAQPVWSMRPDRQAQVAAWLAAQASTT